MRNQRQPIQTDVATDADLYRTRIPNSTRRYQKGNALVPAGLYPGQVIMGADGIEYVVMPGAPPMTARASRNTGAPQAGVVAQPEQRSQSNGKGLGCLLTGVAATLMAIWLVGSLINWWTGLQEDWTYTKDFRTFSIDQAVGHGGDSADHPSHFIVQNDKGKILIIELPADNAQKAVMIPGPTLIGADHEPVTVSFKDTTGSGHVDLLLHFQSQTVVFLNTGEKFVQQNS
jgi:hypothetical protein